MQFIAICLGDTLIYKAIPTNNILCIGSYKDQIKASLSSFSQRKGYPKPETMSNDVEIKVSGQINE